MKKMDQSELFTTPQYTLIIVSTQDDTELVKGGVGIYTNLLTRSLSQNRSNYTIHWVTESSDNNYKTHNISSRLTKHYVSRFADAEAQRRNEKLSLEAFSMKMSTFVYNLVESVTVEAHQIFLESPDWEGLLGPLYQKPLPRNVLKIVRLHSTLSHFAESNELDMTKKDVAQQINLEQMQIENADLISAPTLYITNESMRLGVLHKTSHAFMCPNPIDVHGSTLLVPRAEAITLLRQETGVPISEENFNIFVIGSVERRKGVEIVLAAIEQMCATIANANIYFIGHFTSPDQSQLTANENLSTEYVLGAVSEQYRHRVHAIGELGHHLLLKVLNAGDFFPICYLRDNFPNVVLELALAQRPMTVLLKGGIREMVVNESGEALCMCLEGVSYKELANSLCNWANVVFLNPAGASEKCRRLRDHVLATFDNTKLVLRLFAYYEGFGACSGRTKQIVG